MHHTLIATLFACFVLMLSGTPVSAEEQSPPSKAPDVDNQQSEFKIWKLSDGRRAELAFVRFTDGKVFLKRKDGKIAPVPIDRLSEEDRAWVTRKSKEEPGQHTVSAAPSARFEQVQEGAVGLTMNLSWDEGLKALKNSMGQSPNKRIPVLVEKPKGNLVLTGVELTDAEIASIGRQHCGNSTQAILSTAADGVVVFLSIELGAAEIPKNLTKALQIGKLERKKPLHLVMDAEKGRYILLHEARSDFTVLKVKREESTSDTSAAERPAPPEEAPDAQESAFTISWHDPSWLADAKKSGILHAPDIVWKKTGEIDQTQLELVVETADAKIIVRRSVEIATKYGKLDDAWHGLLMLAPGYKRLPSGKQQLLRIGLFRRSEADEPSTNRPPTDRVSNWLEIEIKI